MSIWVKRVLVGLVVFLVVGQVVRFPRTNPPIDPAREIGAAIPLTPTVSGIFERSCNDCHSNRTVWLWYSGVAPSSWLVAYDVSQGAAQDEFFRLGSDDCAAAQPIAGPDVLGREEGRYAGMAILDHAPEGETFRGGYPGGMRLGECRGANPITKSRRKLRTKLHPKSKLLFAQRECDGDRGFNFRGLAINQDRLITPLPDRFDR